MESLSLEGSRVTGEHTGAPEAGEGGELGGAAGPRMSQSRAWQVGSEQLPSFRIPGGPDKVLGLYFHLLSFHSIVLL